MHKHVQQHDIQSNHDRDTQQTNCWLKSQGLSIDGFTKIDTLLLQAQQIAHNCLKHHGQLLDQREARILNKFLQCLQKKALRQCIKPAQAYKVMNIGTSLNRRVFKKLKQQARQTQAI
jgi:hypothetical protein